MNDGGKPDNIDFEVIAASRRDRAPILERVRQWFLVAILAWAPLPFGSARPWAWCLLGVMTALLLLVSAAAESMSRTARPLGHLAIPAGLSVLVVSWILLQSLPGGVFGLHHPLWDQASDVLGTPLVSSISIDPEGARIHLFRLLIYAAVFYAAWQIGYRRDSAMLIVKAVAVVGVGYAAYGIVQYSSDKPFILWFPKWTYRDDVTSTFVNRNSFATYAGLAVIANLLIFCNTLTSKVDSSSRTTVVLSTIENLLWRGKWAVVGLAVTGSAVLLSHSRGGVTATLFAVVTFSLAVAAAPSLRSRYQLIFMVCVLVGCATLFAISGKGLLVRVAETPIATDGRNDIYGAMLRAIDDNVWVGAGLGSFRFLYPIYQEKTFDGVMDFAHDDYLENALDLGLPGAILLFSTIVFLIGYCVVGIKTRRRDAIFPCVALSASVLVGVHALVDFSMQIPAVAVSYATLLGIGTAQSTSTRRSSDRSRKRHDSGAGASRRALS